jgi:hypothetical protein
MEIELWILPIDTILGMRETWDDDIAPPQTDNDAAAPEQVQIIRMGLPENDSDRNSAPGAAGAGPEGPGGEMLFSVQTRSSHRNWANAVPKYRCTKSPSKKFHNLGD